jgi:hypothetical protein
MKVTKNTCTYCQYLTPDPLLKNKRWCRCSNFPLKVKDYRGVDYRRWVKFCCDYFTSKD